MSRSTLKTGLLGVTVVATVLAMSSTADADRWRRQQRRAMRHGYFNAGYGYGHGCDPCGGVSYHNPCGSPCDPCSGSYGPAYGSYGGGYAAPPCSPCGTTAWQSGPIPYSAARPTYDNDGNWDNRYAPPPVDGVQPTPSDPGYRGDDLRGPDGVNRDPRYDDPAVRQRTFEDERTEELQRDESRLRSQQRALEEEVDEAGDEIQRNLNQETREFNQQGQNLQQETGDALQEQADEAADAIDSTLDDVSPDQEGVPNDDSLDAPL